MLTIVRTLRELKLATAAWRRHEHSIGFIPTMGAIHDGHIALVERAQDLARHVVVSIFVNPLQFGANEDYANYPRTLDSDMRRLENVNCDLLYLPDVAEIYPEGFITKVDPGPLANVLEGQYRPGHFVGVSTVVTKLLCQVLPDYACFGEKDFQQYSIIQKIVRDLSIPTIPVKVPTQRDTDGLAISSRNVYLSDDERERAATLPEVLFDSADSLRAGEDVAIVLEVGRSRLDNAGFVVDYFGLFDEVTFEPLTVANKTARLFAAARIGKTRLIDNIGLS